jgi:hypothetical protein
VPGRSFPVDGGHRLSLRVAVVTGVVVPAVAQVDPADERGVELGSPLMAQDQELLMMGAAGTYPGVEQAAAAGSVDLLLQAAVLGRGERQPVPVRPPDQTADQDPAFGGPGKYPTHAAVGGVGEPLVGIAAPVREQQQVPGAHPLDGSGELGEVGRAVDQRADQVPGGPGLARCVGVVKDGGLVAAFLLGEEPLGRCCRGRSGNRSGRGSVRRRHRASHRASRRASHRARRVAIGPRTRSTGRRRSVRGPPGRAGTVRAGCGRRRAGYRRCPRPWRG